MHSIMTSSFQRRSLLDITASSKLFRISLVLLASIIGRETQADNWPQFRGPTGLGLTPDTRLPESWGEPDGSPVLWKSPLVGEGHASPIVWNDRVFVCTAHWPDTVTDRKQVIPEHHVLCFSAGSGRLNWDITIEPGPWKREDFRSGPGGGYAAPTPATDGKRVYAVFGSSVIAAVDFEGHVVWHKQIVPHNFDVTVGSSPILVDDAVVMLCAMTDPKDSKLIFFDPADGSIRREIPLPKARFAHSTPLKIDVGGTTQLVIAASGGGESDAGIQSIHARTGERLWWCKGGGEAATATFGSGIVYCDSGRGGPGIAIDPTGQGDVTSTHIRWKVNSVPEGIGSPTIVGNRVYRLHTPNILKCWNVEDGKQIYAQRLDRLTSSWASPIVDGNGRLYFATAGVSYVIQSGDDFKVLAVNDLKDPNHASPAVSNGKLFLLGTHHLFCLGSK
jgi:outer membrane protein assembly factor BamB